MKILLLLGLLIITLQHVADNSCAYFDNTPESVQRIASQISNYTGNSTESFIESLTEYFALPDCLTYSGMNDSTHIHYVIRDFETIRNMTTVNPSIQQWLYFAGSYNGSVCANPATTTIAVMCNMYVASQGLIEQTTKMIYPYGNAVPNINITDLIANTTLFRLISKYGSVNYSAPQVKSFSSYFPMTSLGYKKFSSDLPSFTEVIDRIKTPEPFKAAVNKLGRHLYRPIAHLGNVFTSPLFHRKAGHGWSNIKDTFHKLFSHIDVWIDQNKDFEVEYPGNISVAEGIRDMTRQYQTHRIKSQKYAYYRMEKPQNWANLADVNRTIDLRNPFDIYNTAGSIISWLAHLDNQFNQSGCLGKGFPHLPEADVICGKPILAVTHVDSIWPEGFDMYNPRCEEYYNPFTYLRGWINIATYHSGFANWLDRHHGLSPFLGWTVYNYDGDRKLPPNTLPCCIFNGPAPLFLFMIVFGAFAAIGFSLRIATTTMQKIFKEQNNVPDLTRFVPRPNQTLDRLGLRITGADIANLGSAIGTPLANIVGTGVDTAQSNIQGIGERTPLSGARRVPRVNIPRGTGRINIPKIKI